MKIPVGNFILHKNQQINNIFIIYLYFFVKCKYKIKFTVQLILKLESQ